MTAVVYTTQLQAGLGMVDETRILLDLWKDEMDGKELKHAALNSGRFPGMSARRLRNLVSECFAPRLLRDGGNPAARLKLLQPILTTREFEQSLFIATCRANLILADFVREVYWTAYTSGRDTISNQDSRDFVTRANQDGKTSRPWSPVTIRRVGGYLAGTCADFGLLERGRKQVRKILPYRIESRVAILLAYELHLAGKGDNSVIGDPDWGLFGMDRADVLDQLKRAALKGVFIVQSAGSVTRIAWQCKDLKELMNVLAQS